MSLDPRIMTCEGYCVHLVDEWVRARECRGPPGRHD